MQAAKQGTKEASRQATAPLHHTSSKGPEHMTKVSMICPLHTFIQGNPISPMSCHWNLSIHWHDRNQRNVLSLWPLYTFCQCNEGRKAWGQRGK